MFLFSRVESGGTRVINVEFHTSNKNVDIKISEHDAFLE